MRGLILSPAIDPVPNSTRVRVQGLSGQFRMLLICNRAQATSHKLQAPSNKLLDKRLRIWDKVITINKRITHDNSKRIRRKIYRAWQQTQSSGSEIQEPAWERKLYNSGATGAAGGRGRLGPRVKLRHLHAAAAGTDGRGASRARSQTLQAGCGRTARSQVTDRGLRAPAIWDQGSSCKQQATSVKRQATSFR